MSGVTTYNLLDEAWIRARDLDGAELSVSLTEVFAKAHLLRSLAGELPTQDAAVFRLMLAVLYRAVPAGEDAEESMDRWGEWWRRGLLPVDDVLAYLEGYRDRFDLFDPEQPFFQVPDLHTASGKTSGLSKLIAEVPAGHQFFTTRAAEGVASLSFAEAARWLVHCQAYDASGIKTGAVGDSRVKGGRGYPIGIGWTGNLGLIVLEGPTLAHTLLLNWIHSQPNDPRDLPPWESEPLTSAATGQEAPWGYVQALTWQIRRVRLFHDDTQVIDALICNGDAIRLRNQREVEPMTPWRRSEAQEKKYRDEGTIYMARGHMPERALWRGLEGLLLSTPGSGGFQRGDRFVGPHTLDWLAALRIDEILDHGEVVRVRGVGAQYGSNNSMIDNVIHDVLDLRAEVLGSPHLRGVAVEAAGLAQISARLLAQYADDLAYAAGRDGAADRAGAYELAYQTLDRPYRRWVRELSTDTADEDALRWRRQLRGVVRRLAGIMRGQAPTAALRGKERGEGAKRTRVTTDQAFRWFERGLDKEIPVERTDQQTTVSAGGSDD